MVIIQTSRLETRCLLNILKMLNKIILFAILSCCIFSAVNAARENVTFFEREEGDYVIHNVYLTSEETLDPEAHLVNYVWYANEGEIFTQLYFDVPEFVSY